MDKSIRKAGPGATPESTRKISQLAPKSTPGHSLRARLGARLGATSFWSKTRDRGPFHLRFTRDAGPGSARKVSKTAETATFLDNAQPKSTHSSHKPLGTASHCL